MDNLGDLEPEDAFRRYDMFDSAPSHSQEPPADVDDVPVLAPDDWGREDHVEPSYEGTYDAAGFPRTDLYDRVHNLGLPQDSLVVVGSSALEAVVGPGVRRGQDLDIAVTQQAYDYLRNQRQLEEVVEPDGSRRLVGDGIQVVLDVQGKPIEKLRENGYEYNGVTLTGLPDLYEYKQNRGGPSDAADLQLIKDRLYGDKPLPASMTRQEMQFVKTCVPERLHNRPELQVAANGLYIVRTVFGMESETVRSYSGPVEQGVIPATGHAWEHTAYGLRDGQRNIEVVNGQRKQQGQEPMYDDDDRMAHAAGYSNHDVILGHGRRALNPQAHDERQSADLAVRHLEAVGVTDGIILAKTHATTMATTFNERTKGQDIDPARGHILSQELGAGSDMSGFRRSDASVRAVKLAVEDLSRVGSGYDKPLQRLQEDLNSNLPAGAPLISIQAAEDGLELIDEYPDYVVTKNGVQMTLREALADHIESSQRFIATYQFPDSWGLGYRDTQIQQAELLGEIADLVRRGQITGQEALRRVEEFAARQQQA